MDFAKEEKVAEVLGEIAASIRDAAEDLISKVNWEHISDFGSTDNLYNAVGDVADRIEDLREKAHERYNQSPSKVKARGLREKADELLTQAKELECEL